MTQRLREWLSILLLVLLPWHALLITVATKLIQGPGQPPMAELAVWKEAILGIMLLLAVGEILLKNSKFEIRNSKFDLLDGLILLIILLGIGVSLRASNFEFRAFLLGIKYDFVPLIAFLVLRRVSWSEKFLRRAVMGLHISGGLVALYGLLTAFLPQGFFVALGYSDLHSLYVPGRPIAAFQLIGETMIRRVQSGMSGPNQLGLWLLLPLSLGLVSWWERMKREDRNEKTEGRWSVVLLTALCLLLSLVLVLTFSRSAWIAAAVIVSTFFIGVLPRRSLKKVVPAVGLLAVTGLLTTWLVAPSIIARVTSSRGHIEKPLEAIALMREHPLGMGLGTAGPASNRLSEPCVFLQKGDDASWAQAHPDLCVYVGETQVQPLGETCDCPLLTENWYLQLGVEMGWMGLMLSVALTIMVLLKLRSAKGQGPSAKEGTASLILMNGVFLEFLGVSIAGLFLHAWEDAAVAFTIWILVAAIMPLNPASPAAEASTV